MKVRHAGANNNFNAHAHPGNVGEVAIIGGGMSGLLAAVALEPLSRNIRVFERRMDVVLGNTSGGGQQEHGYAIVSGGLDAIHQLSPSLFEALTSGGAWVADASANMRLYEEANVSPNFASNLQILTASRAYIAKAIYDHIRLYPKISIEHATVTRVFPDGIKTIVETDLAKERFDLVIDASGRQPISRNHRPFSRNFYSVQHPVSVSYEPDMAIRTMILDSWKGHDHDWALLIGGMPPPRGSFGSQIMRIEDGKVQIAVAERYSRGSWTIEAAEIIRNSLPQAIGSHVVDYLSDSMLRRQRYRHAYRTRIERAKQHPASFLVLGDALMSTNPIYGLGIASAAIEAQALRSAVKESLRTNDTTLIATKYYASIRKNIDLAWKISSWTDMCYRPTNDRLSPVISVMTPARAAAMRDPSVCRLLYEAASLSTALSLEKTLLKMTFALLKNWANRFAQSTSPTPRTDIDVPIIATLAQVKDDERSP